MIKMNGHPKARSSRAQAAAEPVNAPSHAARIISGHPVGSACPRMIRTVGSERLVRAAHSRPVAPPHLTAHRREQHINFARSFSRLLRDDRARPPPCPKFAASSFADLASIRHTIVRLDPFSAGDLRCFPNPSWRNHCRQAQILQARHASLLEGKRRLCARRGPCTEARCGRTSNLTKPSGQCQ